MFQGHRPYFPDSLEQSIMWLSSEELRVWAGSTSTSPPEPYNPLMCELIIWGCGSWYWWTCKRKDPEQKGARNTILDSALSSKLLRCWGFIYYFSTCGLMSLRLLIDHLIITVEKNKSWCNDLIFGWTCWNDPALSRMAITSFLVLNPPLCCCLDPKISPFGHTYSSRNCYIYMELVHRPSR